MGSLEQPKGGLHLLAPAKVNLHLRVGPARADGFHPLLTWMTTVGLYDALRITSANDLSMSCDDPALPCDGRNLVMKAANAVAAVAGKDKSGIAGGAHIHLTKRIPSGGGLGGGSSDAATVLQGLNQFWNANLALSELSRLAARLGSDVPFFLHAPSAVCTGRGEIVQPVAVPSRARWAVLILPKISMPTPAVYRKFDELKLGHNVDVSAAIDWQAWADLPAEQLLQRLVNDLEAPSFAICPELNELRGRVERKLNRTVCMSGSGSTLFTLYNDGDTANAAAIEAGVLARSIAVEIAPRN